ncbi:hypothetical protein EQH57_0806, partial [Dictyocoela roeselum]
MEHIKGTANVSADILSRNLVPEKLKTIKDVDRETVEYKLKLLHEYITLIKKIPTSISNGRDKQYMVEILKKVHEVLTHIGYKTMKNTLSDFKDTHKINKFIKRVCETCEKCQKEKENFIKTPEINIINHMPELHEVIAVDIKGPVKYKHFKSKTKFKIFYILVITEYLSRYTEIAIINDIHSTTICKAIDKSWFKVHGYSKVCITDNGRQFNSLNFQSLLKQYNISHINTSPHNPSGNSVVERINKEIGIALRFSRNSSLNECLLKIWRRINLSVNRSTGFSPYRIFFKMEKSEQGILRASVDIQSIKNKLMDQLRMNVENKNKKKCAFIYKKGDLILKRNLDPDKIAPRYLRPFEIIDIGRLQNSLIIDEGFRINRISTKT